MKYNQNRRLLCACYAAGLILLTGSTSLAAGLSAPETDTVQLQAEAGGETAADGAAWDFAEITAGIHEDTVAGIRAAVEKAHEDYIEKVEEERRKAEEEAAREAAAQASAQTAAKEKELLAALIFCEAGNQPYEGQVAVGAVVMNRVNSGQFPDTITDVIYQSGQFTPAMTGWLDPPCRRRAMHWPGATRSGTASISAPVETAISWAIISSGKRRSVLYYCTGRCGKRHREIQRRGQTCRYRLQRIRTDM